MSQPAVNAKSRSKTRRSASPTPPPEKSVASAGKPTASAVKNPAARAGRRSPKGAVDRAAIGAPGAKTTLIARQPNPAAQPRKAKATTLRLTPILHLGLELLQGVLKRPINKMVNEAVEGFIETRTAEVESDLRGVLAQIKAYRRVDPHFEAAIAQFVEAEAHLGGTDPLEGVVVEAESSKAAPAHPRLGPAQAMVRDLLDR